MYLQTPQNGIVNEQRVRWLIRITLGIIFILLIRALYLQVFQGDKYQSLAENNRVRLIRTRTPRGIIYDRKGIPLATNRRVFSIFFDPVGEDGKEKEQSFQNLIKILMAQKSIVGEALARQANSTERYKPQKLAEDVDFGTVAAIREQSIDLPGVYVKDEFIRYYPLGNGTSHLMGYLRGINVDELQKPQYEEYDFDDVLGRDGLEQLYEQDLRGQAGGWMIEVDSKGRKRREIGTRTPIPGDSLVLNIDYQLQKKAYELLQGKRGTIIAIDPNTGGVLAMVSEPSYDSNILSGYIKGNEWAKIANDPQRPLNNRAVMGMYPPGSVFKLITAVAGLEEKKITPNSTFFCPGYIQMGQWRFKCHTAHGHGTLNLIQGITMSCNVYFYHTGQLVGIDSLLDYAKQFGIGQVTGIDLPGEIKAINPELYKKQYRKSGWYPGDAVQLAIGQGFMVATPLQMINIVATIANGGTRYRPFLVKQIEDGNGKIIHQSVPTVLEHLQVTPETFASVQKGMWGVVNNGGTGGMAALKNIEVAGKTGTAESGTGGKDIAWFCGYAPFNKPEIVVLAMVEEGGFGGVTAAPMAHDIFQLYFDEKNGTKPPADKSPKEDKKIPEQVASTKIIQ